MTLLFVLMINLALNWYSILQRYYRQVQWLTAYINKYTAVFFRDCAYNVTVHSQSLPGWHWHMQTCLVLPSVNWKCLLLNVLVHMFWRTLVDWVSLF